MASTESNLTGGSGSSASPYEGDRRSSDQILRDIERQRYELDVSTEVLQQRLAPRELAGQIWSDVRDRVGGGAGEVADLVRRHPVPLGLIGAGIAWWLYQAASDRGQSYEDDFDENDIGVGSSGSTYGAEEYGEGWGKRSVRAAQRSTERLRESVTSARQGFTESIDRNPLALGAACFSVGILAGIAVPSSNWEHRTLGDASAKLGRKARDAASEAAVRVVEEGARAAQTAVDRLREEADRPVTLHRATDPADASTTATGSQSQPNRGDTSTLGGEKLGQS